MSEQRLSFIIAFCGIFMQDCIFCISAVDIFIIAECVFIKFWQRLFFIIAVFDIRLQDIAIFMSADDIFIGAIEEWFIEAFGVCALAGMPAAMARMIEAYRIFVGFMMHQRVKGLTGVPPKQPWGTLVPKLLPYKRVRLRSRHLLTGPIAEALKTFVRVLGHQIA